LVPIVARTAVPDYPDPFVEPDPDALDGSDVPVVTLLIAEQAEARAVRRAQRPLVN
jgi:hypothetical protein